MAEYEVLTPLRAGKTKIIPAGAVFSGDPKDPEIVEKVRFKAIKLVPGSDKDAPLASAATEAEEEAEDLAEDILAAVRKTIGEAGKRPTVKEVSTAAGFTVKAAEIDTALATIAAEKAPADAGGNPAEEA